MESRCSILECAPKICPKRIHAARFRAGYFNKDIQESLCIIFQFLDEINRWDNVFLERRILRNIVDKTFDLSMIVALGIGIDKRVNMNDSKVKCYFLLQDYPEKLDQVLSFHPPIDRIDDYLIHNDISFGIEMYFDGRTNVEIYPCIKQGDLSDAELIDRLQFGNAIIELITECRAVAVSFENTGKRVLHFHPCNPTKFVRLIGNRQISLLYSNVQILHFLYSKLQEKIHIDFLVSLIEDEIISKNLQNINLQ